MKGIPFKPYADASILTITQLLQLLIQQRQAFIQVEAFHIKPTDWKLRTDASQKLIPFPFFVILSAECTGIVIALTPPNSIFQVSAPLYAGAPNRYANYMAADVDGINIISAILNVAEAARLFTTNQIAFFARLMHNLKANQRVMIDAASVNLVDDTFSHNQQNLSKNSENYALILDSDGGKTQLNAWSWLRVKGMLLSRVSNEQQRVASEQKPAQREFGAKHGDQGPPASTLHQLFQAKNTTCYRTCC